MNRNEFEIIRSNRIKENIVADTLVDLFKSELNSDEILSKVLNEPVQFEISITNDNGNLEFEVNTLDKSKFSYKIKKRKRDGDKQLIDSCEMKYKDLAIEILNFIRELHPSGEFIKSHTSKRYTNYDYENDKVYNKLNSNFVSIIPQKDSLKVFIIDGDYIPFSHIILEENKPRYKFFKINDRYQLGNAFEALELSYYYWHKR